MGWDAVILGELELPVAKQKAWLDARATIAEADWPPIFAPDDDLVGADRGVVGELVEELRAIHGGPAFFELVADGSTLTLHALLDEDTFRDVLDNLVAVVSAASACGAKGRVEVRNAGTLTGGVIELAGKAIRGRALTGKPTSADKRRVDAVLQRVRPAVKPAAAPRDAAIARLQALVTRTAAQERELRDRLQLATIKENRARRSPADVKSAIRRIEARLKAHAKKPKR